MEEAWERAVEAKLEGMATPSSELRVLNLDGAVKSIHGCLPPAELLERFPGLEHLSIANVGVTSLERFPRLRNLRRLILSDNRISGGLESLVDAGLESLRDFDLSNNRIQHIDDLAPLAALHLVSLDLYECPVTRVKDYRSKVFSMIRTLKYLDKLDANENERPETDEEEEEEEDEDEEYDDDEEDSWNGEVDGGDHNGKLTSDAGNSVDGDEGIVDADEDEGSDADEEEIETNGRRTASGSSGGSGHHLSNGFRVTATGAAFVVRDEHDGDGDDVEAEDEDDDDDLGEEIDEDEADYDDDAAEMLVVLDSDEEDEDGLDEAEVDEEEIDEDGDEEEEVDEDDEEEDAEPVSTGRLASAEGEIDGHDHGEEDENGEIGEEDDEEAVDDRDAEEEDYGESEDEDDLDDKYLMQPIARSSRPDSSVVGNEDDEIDYEDDSRPNTETLNQASSSAPCKRRRDEKDHLEEDEDGDDDDDETEEMKPSKRR